MPGVLAAAQLHPLLLTGVKIQTDAIMTCICKSREQWITPNSTQGRELRELGTNEAVDDVLAGKQHTLASFLKSSSTTQGLLCKEQSIEKQSWPPRWFDSELWEVGCKDQVARGKALGSAASH